MKFAAPLLCLGVANAFVLPDAKPFLRPGSEDDQQWSFWDKLPSKESVVSTFKNAADTVTLDNLLEAVDRTWNAKDSLQGLLEDGFDDDFDAFDEYFDEFDDEFDEFDEFDDDFDDGSDGDFEEFDHPHGPGHRRPHKGHRCNLTVYELISKSKHTTKFAKLVDEHDDIVKLLNSTEANYTLFVPVDEAFEHIPDDKKPSKEFIEAVLRYHVGVGLYPVRRILATHTLPTAYRESWLDDKPQRLRTSVSLSGLRVNFYSKVIASNVVAKNGIIHAVNHILVPPPMVGKEISLFPSVFSTLLLAYEKTEFVKFIHNVKMSGSTVFAPSNGAFAKLGVPANAFLFNTEAGLKYLKALLKYQIVANATLYSDAFYEAGKDKDTDIGSGHHHLDLATLLDDKSIAVDIARWGGFIRMRLNGYVRVGLQDGIAKNGVIQVVDSVPIPPHKHHGDEGLEDGQITVEELKERLAGFLDDEEQQRDEDKEDVDDIAVEL